MPNKSIKNTLGFKLTLSVFIMTLPLVGMLLYTNFYAIQVVREQVSETYVNTLEHHVNQIDDDLASIDAYLNSISGLGSSDLISLSVAESDTDYYMSKIYLYGKLTDEFSFYRSLNGLFVYVEGRQEYMEVIKESFSLTEREKVQQYVIALIENDKLPQRSGMVRWQAVEIDENYYLINVMQAGDAYLGAWIKMDNLLTPIKNLNLGAGGEMLFADHQGKPITNSQLIGQYDIKLNIASDAYFLSGQGHKFLIIGGKSNRANLALYALIPDSVILENLPFLQRLIWIITIIVLLFIPFGFYTMIRTFLIPLKRVLLAMKKVRSGDWSIRVETGHSSDEFQILGYSFNAMMEEIQRLRVNVYEEQLNKQREELYRLQLQINPHFFLNSLNIVYNLAKVKNFNVIMDMTMSLIRYFRYLFRSNTTFIKLKDELELTRNYLNIQALRFPNKLTWEFDSPEYLSDIPVPPLVIQTFVENSIKHAVTMEEAIHITIHAKYIDEEGSGVIISVMDTGTGFNEDTLLDLQAGKSMLNDQGEHTGIWNVQRRLGLLYNNLATLQFENDQEIGGAIVSITLPTDLHEEGTA